MAKDEAKLKFSADDTEVSQAWRKQFEHLDRLERKLDSAGKHAQASAAKGEKSFLSWGLAIDTATKAIQTFAAEAEAANRATLDSAKQSAQATRSWDANLRKLGRQSSIYDQGALESLGKQISAIARDNNFTRDQAMAGAIDLVSRGFAPDDVIQGGVLNELLGNMLAMNREGTDPTQHIGAMTAILNAFGKELTAENLREAGQQIWGGFKGTSLQAEHVARSAAVATGWRSFTDGTLEEFVASQAVLSNVLLDPGQQATALQNVSANFATARSQPNKVRALREAGLTPDKVDFQGEGEGWLPFLDLMAGVKSRMSPEEWNAWSATMVEKSNVPGFTALIEGRDEIRERLAFAGDREAYERDVNFGRGGEDAAARRAEANVEESRYQAGMSAVDIFRQEIEAKGRKIDPATGKARLTPRQIQLYQEYYDSLVGDGESPEDALMMAVGMNAAGGRDFWGQVGGVFSGGTWKDAYQQSIVSAGRNPELVTDIFKEHRELLAKLNSTQEKQIQLQEKLLTVLGEEGKIVLEHDGVQRPGKKVAP